MSPEATGARNRAALEHMWKAVTSGHLDELDGVLHPDFVQEIPQSGERIVGIGNFRRIVENLPGEGAGLVIADDPYVTGEQEHFVMTPTFNVVKVEGTGDQLTSYVKARYPDGSDWYIVTFSSFKDGMIVKRVDFYAPCFTAPPWRAQWVEHL